MTSVKGKEVFARPQNIMELRSQPLKNLIFDPDKPVEKIPLRMGLKNVQNFSKNSSHQVFSMDQEKLLEEYLLKSSKLNYGLTVHAMRELAYLFAVSLDRKMPKNWNLNQKAGEDWATGFIKRHRNISLRKPENTSLARNMNFNKEQMSVFYNNMEELMDLHNFQPSQILNIDETGLSSVLQAPKVLAASGSKQVGQLVSNERGEQITVTGIVTAAGDVIPPIYLFPRKRIHEEYMEGCPDGSIAIFNGTGWMTGESFIEVLKHVVTHKNPSKENPILIVLDNHSSHSTLEAIEFCRDNGIHMISFPPHTTHRAQPLDISVFGPFKARCKILYNTWLGENPGKRITIHNIVRVSSSAVKTAFTDKNIRSGFIKAGICALDRTSLFRELDALGDDAIATSQSSTSTTPATESSTSNDLPSLPVPHPELCPETIGRNNASFSNLEDLRPIPNISSGSSGPKKASMKRGISSTILTSSPEKRKKKEQQERNTAKMEKKCVAQKEKPNTRSKAKAEKTSLQIIKIEKK